MHRTTLAGIVSVAALAVGGVVLLVAWSFAPPGPESQLVASLDPTWGTDGPGARRVAPRGTGHALGARRGASAGHVDPARAREAERPIDPRPKPARTVAEEVRARNLDDEERAQLRRELREERLIDMNMRLDRFAADEGWDPDTTDAVRDILIDTADRITRTLARVERREVAWDDVKGELWTYREGQAASVRRALGDDDFDRFVDDMEFARFFGDVPVRGRVE